MNHTSNMEIRIDPISGTSVILATNRSKRPRFGKKVLSGGQRTDINPFAPGNEAVTGLEAYSVSDNPQHRPNDPTWRVRVIPNKFPIVPDHEVIIHSPDEKRDFDRLSRRQVELIIEVYQERYRALARRGEVFLFCNHGPAAGASVAHPHSQILALPVVPAVTAEKLSLSEAYYAQHGQCSYCRLIEEELRLGLRVVWQNDYFVLLCPEASVWPYQLTLLPKIHQAQFSSVKASPVKKENQIAALAEAMQTMIGLYNSVLDKPDYNFWIHSVSRGFFHWHLELIPRTKIWAGLELGAGLMVNDKISPEAAAKVFRKSLA